MGRLGGPGAVLRLVLNDAKGVTLARWHVHARAGRHTLSLLLPPKARHKGHDRLRVSAAGAKAVTVSLTVT
jgi:hypothetical protein